MPAPPTSHPEQFVQGAPVLHVADVKATAAYYRDDACHAEISDRGADVVETPADRPYRIRELVVRDPNGIDIVFGQDIA